MDSIKNLFAVIILFLTLSSCSQEIKCSDFKDGEFKYADSLYSSIKIIKTESTIIEIDTNSGLEMHSSIEWISDCNYILTVTAIYNSDLKEAIGNKIEVEIIETTQNGYTFKSISEHKNLELEVIKVN